jgi:hypothetical protein
MTREREGPSLFFLLSEQPTTLPYLDSDDLVFCTIFGRICNHDLFLCVVLFQEARKAQRVLKVSKRNRARESVGPPACRVDEERERELKKAKENERKKRPKRRRAHTAHLLTWQRARRGGRKATTFLLSQAQVSQGL